MPTRLLAPRSLAATLWNLEEARLAGRSAAEYDVGEALDWVVGRFGQADSYQRLLPAPTAADLASLRAEPTAEGRAGGKSGVRHVLGEEAVRALALWDRSHGWDRPAVAEGVAGLVHRDRGPGFFCCRRCSIARWRAIAALRPTGWEETLADGVELLSATPLTAAGRWRGTPFCYALLALAEMPADVAAPALERVRPAARAALRRVHPDDQPGRFRRWALLFAAGTEE